MNVDSSHTSAKTVAIVDLLSVFFEQRRPVPQSAIHFLETALGDVPLSVALADSGNPEHEALLELCLELSESELARLEPLLAAAEVEGVRKQHVAKAMASRDWQLRFVDGTEVALRPEDLAVLAARLGFGHGAGQKLRKALHLREKDTAGAILARLRQHRIVQDPAADGFLASISDTFLAPRPDGPGLAEALELASRILRILPEPRTPDDIWTALQARCQQAVSALRLAKQQREQLAGANLESLFSRGIRFPHVDEANAKRELALLPAIGLAVYGRSPMAEEPREVDLGSVDELPGEGLFS